jgi:hypothetical protein
MRLRQIAVVITVSALAVLAPSVAAEAKPAKEFKNCTALNKVYPHGVGLPKAKDKTSGDPVRSFKKSKPLYKANKKSDRDGDGIACEKL